MKWKKLGKIFKACGQFDWMNSHTSMPSAIHIKDDIYRILFSTRCKDQKSRIAYLEIDLNCPSKILDLSSKPLLGIGNPGFFDDSGVYPGNILKNDNNALYLYFCGRNNGTPPLYYMSIGIAISKDQGKTFRRVYNTPILSRSEADPWMVSTPHVIKENDKYYMFYLSGIKWDLRNNRSFYDIKSAISSDGHYWYFQGKTVLSLKKGETNIAAPTIVKWRKRNIMFFSYVRKTTNYRIGMASQEGPEKWSRLEDPLGLLPGPDSWDSEAMAYPHAFWHKEKLYLLYAGNGNGRDGIGLAICE